MYALFDKSPEEQLQGLFRHIDLVYALRQEERNIMKSKVQTYDRRDDPKYFGIIELEDLLKRDKNASIEEMQKAYNKKQRVVKNQKSAVQMNYL